MAMKFYTTAEMSVLTFSHRLSYIYIIGCKYCYHPLTAFHVFFKQIRLLNYLKLAAKFMLFYPQHVTYFRMVLLSFFFTYINSVLQFIYPAPRTKG